MRRLRFKQFLSERNQFSQNGEETLLSVSEYYGVKPRAEAFEGEEHETRATTLEGYRIAKKDDLVMNYMLAWKGAYGVSAYDGIVSPAYSVFEVKKDIVNCRYLHHRVRSDDMKAYFRSRSKGIIESRLRLYPDSLLASYVDLPDLPTQRAIADFLDRETARIDTLIEKKQRLVELLGEKRKAKIDSMVSPNFEAAKVAAPWRRSRIKFHIKSFFGGGTPSKDNMLYWTNGNIPWVTPKDMKRRIIDSAEDLITEEAVRESAANMVPISSVLMVVRSGILKHSLPVAINSSPVALNQDMKAFVFKPSLLPHFFQYWVEGKERKNLLDWCQVGATVDSINTDAMLNSEIDVPSVDLQRHIVKVLDIETCRISAVAETTSHSIDRLKEYRSALITSAVTGQIDVTKWTNAGTTDRQLDAIEEEFGA